MFEFNIVDGMPVHNTKWKVMDGIYVLNKKGNGIRIATGGIIWKLAFKCAACGNLSEECYCYSNQESMVKDREEHKSTWYCSLDCMVKSMTPEEQRAWVNKYRRGLYKRYHSHPPFVKWWDIDEVIEYMLDAFECDDPWFPEGSDLECPA